MQCVLSHGNSSHIEMRRDPSLSILRTDPGDVVRRKRERGANGSVCVLWDIIEVQPTDVSFTAQGGGSNALHDQADTRTYCLGFD